MSEHLNDDQIQRYRSNHLSSNELAVLNRHVQVCGDCAKELMTPEERKAAFMILISDFNAPPEHLDFELLQKYVDERADADERKTVESHVAQCSRCRQDLQSLKLFRAQMPEEIHALNSLMAQRTPTPSKRPVSFLAPVWIAGFSLGGAALAAALLWVFCVQPRQAQIGRLQRENELLAKNASGQISRAQWEQLQQQSRRLQADALQAKVDRLRVERDALATQAALNQKLQLSRNQNQALEAGMAREKDRANMLQALVLSDKMKLNSLSRQIAALEKSKQEGRIVLPLRSDERSALAMLDTTHKMPVDIPGALSGGPLSRGFDFGPSRPVKTLVMSNRPTLNWNPLPRAKSYEVEVRTVENGNANRQVVAKSVPGSETSWTVESPLKRGMIYEWHIEAVLPNGKRQKAVENPTARFQVATRETVERYLIEQMQRAALYAHDGLLDNAEAALDEVIEANADPTITQKARELRRSLDSQR